MKSLIWICLLVFAVELRAAYAQGTDYPRSRHGRRRSQDQINQWVNSPAKHTGTNQPISKHPGTDTGLPDFAAMMRDPIILGLGDTHPHQQSAGHHVDLAGEQRDVGHPHDTITQGKIDTLPGVVALPAGHHVDLVGEHNNPHDGPSIHTDAGHHVKIKPNFGHPPISVPHGHADKLPGVVSTKGDHIDYPGQHDNTHKGPVLHKADGTHLHIKPDVGHPHDTIPQGKIDTLPGVVALPPGHHVDLVGEHNNPHDGPSIHTDAGHHVKIKPNFGHPPISVPHGHSDKLPGVVSTKGDHIDYPGQHENMHKVPILHKADGTHLHIKPDVGHPHDTIPQGKIDTLPGVVALPAGHHVDLVGEHNNPHDGPSIHTDAGHHVKIKPNFGPPPISVPHGHADKLPGVVSTKGDLIDYPGQHENTHKVPVLHKADGTHLHIKPDVGHPHDTIPQGKIDTLPGVVALPAGHHVDLVGEHNNPHDGPSIHTDAGHHVKIKPNFGHPPISDPHGHADKLPGVVSTKGDHIDFPGQHENTHKVPVLHKADGTHLHIKPDVGMSLTHHPKIKPDLGHPPNEFPNVHTDKQHSHFNPGSNKPVVAPVDGLPNLFDQHNNAHETIIDVPNYLPRLNKPRKHKPFPQIKSKTKPHKPIIQPVHNFPDLSGQHHVPKEVVAVPDYLPRFDKVNKPKPITPPADELPNLFDQHNNAPKTVVGIPDYLPRLDKTSALNKPLIPPADELPNLFEQHNTAPKAVAGTPDYLPRLDKMNEPLPPIRRTVRKKLKTVNRNRKRKQKFQPANRRGNFRNPKRQRINKFRDMHSESPHDNLQSTIIKEASKETPGSLPPLRKPFRRFNRVNRFRNLRRGRFRNNDRRRGGRGRWRNRRRFRGRGRNLKRILRRLRRD